VERATEEEDTIVSKQNSHCNSSEIEVLTFSKFVADGKLFAHTPACLAPLSAAARGRTQLEGWVAMQATSTIVEVSKQNSRCNSFPSRTICAYLSFKACCRQESLCPSSCTVPYASGSSCTAWLKREWPSEEDHCRKELQYYNSREKWGLHKKVTDSIVTKQVEAL
jgi:hypothetical protein